MPKVAKELTPIEIKRLAHPGAGKNPVSFPVGGVAGLLMQVTSNGGKSWLLRVQIGDKRREIGLGGYPTVTLAQARDRAREMRQTIWNGVDPVEQRKAARAALMTSRKRTLTFADAVDRFLKDKAPTEGNAKAWAQWRSTLEAYALPELGKMAVADIETADVQRVLSPIWATKNETASRLRGRIEAVLSYATVLKYRSGENPARWRGNLKEVLTERKKVRKRGNHPALPYAVAPAWFADLRQRDGIAAKALEFAVMTAARSGEVRGATWAEIDTEKAVWTVPANRMKAGKEHIVPLSPPVLALLETLPRLDGCDLLFPSPTGKELSDMTLAAVMKRMHADKLTADVAEGIPEAKAGWRDPKQDGRVAVPHGLRSTFRDWVANETSFPGDLAEAALAHTVAGAVEAAYRRGDMLAKRRHMMAAWAAFMEGQTIDNVVALAVAK